jgi:hypothetical protein
MTENQEGPGRKRRSGEEIKRLVLEFEASGLRQNEFCRNHGLALSTLQRQLKKRRLNKSEAKEGGRFVAVKLAGPEPNEDVGSRYGPDLTPRPWKDLSRYWKGPKKRCLE